MYVIYLGKYRVNTIRYYHNQLLSKYHNIYQRAKVKSFYFQV